MNTQRWMTATLGALAMMTAAAPEPAQAFGHRHRVGVYDECCVPGVDHYGHRYTPRYGCAGLSYSAYYGCAGLEARSFGCAGLYGCARPYGRIHSLFGCAGRRGLHGCAGYRDLYGCAGFEAYGGCYGPRHSACYAPAYYRPIHAYRAAVIAPPATISYAPPAWSRAVCCTPAATCCGPVATCCTPLPTCVGAVQMPPHAYPGMDYLTPSDVPVEESLPLPPGPDSPPPAPPADDFPADGVPEA